ncbi:MAG: Spy/CpxP family protein refolding chaperone [Elusimicrobiota bacterium]
MKKNVWSAAVVAAMFCVVTTGIAFSEPMPCGGQDGGRMSGGMPAMRCAGAGQGIMPQGGAGMGDGLGGFGPDLQKLGKKLNLTEDQKSKIESIKRDVQKKVVKIRADVQIAEIDLQELMDKVDVDDKAVLSKVQELHKLRGQMVELTTSALLQSKKVLTPEQRKIINDMRKQMRCNMMPNRMGDCNKDGKFKKGNRGSQHGCEDMDDDDEDEKKNVPQSK